MNLPKKKKTKHAIGRPVKHSQTGNDSKHANNGFADDAKKAQKIAKHKKWFGQLNCKKNCFPFFRVQKYAINGG